MISSIKHQTIALLIGLSASIALVFSLITLVTAFMVEDAIVYQMLEQQAAQLEQSFSDGEVQLPSGFSYYPSQQSVPEWAQARIARPQATGEIPAPGGKHYHYQLLTGDDSGHIPGGVLLAEVSGLLVVTNQPGLFVLCALAIVVILVLSAVLASLFARRIVNPVLQLTDAVKKAEKSGFDCTMPELRYELGYLADRLQQSFTTLNQAVEKERAFATNVSHELRTPLTVMQNSCSLIAQRGFAREDANVLQQATRQMQVTVDTLLALARSQLAETQATNVLAQLEQAILQLDSEEGTGANRICLQEFDITFSLPEDWQVKADNHLFRILLANLLLNAIQHACQPRLAVYCRNNQLILENPVEGQPLSDPALPGVRRDGSTGVGQGLYLAARIAEHLGWHLFTEIENGCFRVVLVFSRHTHP